MRLICAALAFLLLAPAVADAAKIKTTTTEVEYVAEGSDAISMRVFSAFDQELAATAVWFAPSDATAVDPTTTDANCRARPTGNSSCALGNRVTHITLLGQNDFVLVDASGDTVLVDAGGGNDTVRTSGTGTKMVSNGE